jgi:tRNA pseudouridine55 synthase
MASGILLLDKPSGLSSNAALQRVRALLARQKAGHVGSLDPLATGMLPICLGEATKIAGEILSRRKRYRFTLALGARTATGDTEGAVTGSSPVPPLERRTIEAALAGFLGRQEQTPPMYSALKREGRPLYELARAGLTVARSPREIELFALELLELAPGALTLETLCSKGTYIRVLAEDLAVALGTVGHVRSLRRLYVEPFESEPMHTLEILASECARGVAPRLLPTDWPLTHLRAVHLARAEAQRLLTGQSLADPSLPAPGGLNAPGDTVRLYDDAGVFLGLGVTDGSGTLRPRRLLNPEAAGSGFSGRSR